MTGVSWVPNARSGAQRGPVSAIAADDGLWVGVAGGRWRRIPGLSQVIAGPEGFVAVGRETVHLDPTGRVTGRSPTNGPVALADGQVWQQRGAEAVSAGRAPVALGDGRLVGGAGPWLFVAGRDHLERVDVGTGQREGILHGQFHAVVGTADGRWLATGSGGWSSTAGEVESGPGAVGDGFFAVGGLVRRDDGAPVARLPDGFVLADGPHAVSVAGGVVRAFDPRRPDEARGPRWEVRALAAGGGWVAASDRDVVTVYRDDGRVAFAVPLAGRSIEAPAVAIGLGTLWIGTSPLQRFELATGRRLGASRTTPWVRGVQGLPDGGALVVDHERVLRFGPGGAVEWTVGPFPKDERQAARVVAAALDPDGRTLAVALDAGPSRIGPAPGGPFRTGPEARAVVALGGGRFALGAHFGSVEWAADGTTRAREPFEAAIATGPVFVRGDTAELPAGPGRFAEAWQCLAADGDRLYTATVGAGVAVRDLATGARRGLLRSDVGGKVVALAVSRRWLAVGEWRRVHLWDLAERVPRWVRTLDLRASREETPPGIPEEGIGEVRAVSLDGGLHVACGVGLSWTAPVGLGVEAPRVLAGGEAGWVSGVADGGRAWLVEGDEPRIRDVDGGVRVRATADWDRDHGEDLSPDGRRLLIRRGRSLRVVDGGGEVGGVDVSAPVAAARFGADGAVWGLVEDKRVAFRWDPDEDSVREAFAWPRGHRPAHDVVLAGAHALLDGFDGPVRVGPGGPVRLHPREGRTAMAVGADGTAVTAAWSGRVALWDPDGSERAELLVALDGRWRVRIDGAIAAEAP